MPTPLPLGSVQAPFHLVVLFPLRTSYFWAAFYDGYMLYLWCVTQLAVQSKLFIPVQSVRFRNGPDDPAGITGGYHIGWNILRNHTAGTNDGVVANGNTGTDDGIAADPDMAADGYRNSVIMAVASDSGVNGVVGGIDGNLGTEHHIVTDGDLPAIQENTIVVAEKVVTDADIVAVVTEEGGFDIGVLARVGKQFLYQGLFLLRLCFKGLVQKPGDAHGIVMSSKQVFVQFIEHPVLLQLPFGHDLSSKGPVVCKEHTIN